MIMMANDDAKLMKMITMIMMEMTKGMKKTLLLFSVFNWCLM